MSGKLTGTVVVAVGASEGVDGWEELLDPVGGRSRRFFSSLC